MLTTISMEHKISQKEEIFDYVNEVYRNGYNKKCLLE